MGACSRRLVGWRLAAPTTPHSVPLAFATKPRAPGNSDTPRRAPVSHGCQFAGCSSCSSCFSSRCARFFAEPLGVRTRAPRL
eukprot:1168963-Prymnesium_polylepis.2